MHRLHDSWPYVRDFLSAAYVAALIAIASAIVGWMQLSYAKKRDAALDLKNTWEKIHKAMMEFRFRREVLNGQRKSGITDEVLENAVNALHHLRGELDRAPDSPLIQDIADYMENNLLADQWRAPEFAPKFDKLTQEAALKAQGK